MTYPKKSIDERLLDLAKGAASPEEREALRIEIENSEELKARLELMQSLPEALNLPEPSEADWRITKRLREAGKLLEIGLVDHLIISRTAVASLREMPRWTALS